MRDTGATKFYKMVAMSPDLVALAEGTLTTTVIYYTICLMEIIFGQ